MICCAATRIISLFLMLWRRWCYNLMLFRCVGADLDTWPPCSVTTGDKRCSGVTAPSRLGTRPGTLLKTEQFPQDVADLTQPWLWRESISSGVPLCHQQGRKDGQACSNPSSPVLYPQQWPQEGKGESRASTFDNIFSFSLHLFSAQGISWPWRGFSVFVTQGISISSTCPLSPQAYLNFLHPHSSLVKALQSLIAACKSASPCGKPGSG